MTDTLPFLQVDVFTDRPFLGNPVAVVLDADGLDGAAMQRIARWTNLSETTFVLQPTAAGADYALRIFTPDRELPFAGHPTLGSARAVIDTGRARPRAGRLVQQCAAGQVALRVDDVGGRLYFEVPASRVGPVAEADAAAVARALGLDGPPPRLEAIDVGPIWLTAALHDAEQVLSLQPDMAALATISRRLRVTGVTVHAPRGTRTDGPWSDSPDIAVRSFAPAAGVPEDPVCGSGNACVALQRRASGQRDDYVAAQGEAIGRAGRIAVAFRNEAIEVGGATVVCVEGRLRTA
ncbi:MAG: PhzF family phenazine biosynthesis protein [Burkholderiales bacterium]|nr:MAG: PhzF family phenazine biosynthesis protein [Burkholderiales bacterium]